MLFRFLCSLCGVCYWYWLSGSNIGWFVGALVHWYHSVPVKRGRNRVPLIPFVATWLSSSMLNNLVPSFACCVYCSSCGFIGWPTELLLSLLLIVITPWYTGTDRYQWSEDGPYNLLLGYGTDGMMAPFSLLLVNSDSLPLLVQCWVLVFFGGVAHFLFISVGELYKDC
jgi:hypothetical protein